MLGHGPGATGRLGHGIGVTGKLDHGPGTTGQLGFGPGATGKCGDDSGVTGKLFLELPISISMAVCTKPYLCLLGCVQSFPGFQSCVKRTLLLTARLCQRLQVTVGLPKATSDSMPIP
jgi:hypothetical protein